MDDRSLKTRLERVADLAGEEISPPEPAVFGSRRRARHRITLTAIGAAAVVVVLAVGTALFTGSSRPTPPAGDRTGRLPAPSVRAVAGQVGAAQLARYRWRALPPAPIPTRVDGAAAVWTGSQMLVWGGATPAGQARSDGASYDPTTRTWLTLPRSPLTARTGPAYTWTGHDLFIWGGRGGQTNGNADGALYDPQTHTWRQLPTLDIPDQADPVAVWTGSRVVLLTTARGLHVTSIAVHAYNPTANSWTALPSIHIPQTTLLGVSALVAGTRLYVWAPVQTVSSSGLQTDNDGFLYQPASNTWTATDLLPTQNQYSVGDALWTGGHIIFQPNGLDCTCGGIPGASSGSWADPNSGKVTAVPTWQSAPASSSTFSWTGNAILAVGNAHAAAWNPTTKHWTDLRPAPFQGGAVQIWTGTTLLIWGQLEVPPNSKGTANERPVSSPTGLEFTP